MASLFNWIEKKKGDRALASLNEKALNKFF
jgi:hypothetical protein